MAEVNWGQELRMGAAVAGGVAAIDIFGETVKRFLAPYIPAQYIDPAVEAIIGAVLIYAGHRWVGPGWRDVVIMAGRAGIGHAIANLIRPYLPKIGGSKRG